MIGLLFGLISLVFAALTVYLKNDIFRNFFMLMTMLNIVISIYAAAYAREVETCSPAETGSVCIKTIELTGINDIMYGYSMLILAFFAIYIIRLLVKSSSMVLP